MWRQLLSHEGTLYLATALIVALTLAQIPLLGLTPDETRALIGLAVAGLVYTHALVRTHARFALSRIAPVAVLLNTLFVTLTFAILYRATHAYWILYFVLPLAAALLYGARWAYLSGALAVLGYLAVVTMNGMMRAEPAEALMNVGGLVIFSIITARLAASERRRAREQEALNTLGAAMNLSLRLEEVGETAADQVMALLRVDAVAIFTVEGDEIVLRAHRGLSPEFLAGIRDFKVGEGITGRVAQTGKIEMVTSGVRRDRRVTREGVRRSDFESYVGIPLFVRGRVVGVMNLATRQPRVFAADDLAFFTEVGNHIAAAIENARLYDETQARARRLARLNEFAAALNRNLDLKTLLADAQRIICELLQLETAWVTLIDDAAGGFMLAADHNLPAILAANDKREMRWKSCRCQRMLLDGKLTEAVNIVQCERFGSVGMMAYHASVPLQSGERILGLLNVIKHTGEALAPEDLQALCGMGAQLGVAIERVRLHEQVKTQHSEEQAALLKLSQNLAGLSNADAILDRAAEAVQEVFHPTLVSLMLPDERREHLILRAGRGWEPELYGTYSVDIATSREGYAFVNGEAMWLEDVQGSARFPCSRGLVEHDIHSSLTAPLNGEHGTLGTLCVHFRERRAFSDDDVRLLSLIANQTALAYERARHHDEALAHIGALMMLNQLAERISSTIDLDALLQTIADSARELAHAQYAALGILDAEGRITQFITSGMDAQARAHIGDLPQGRGLLGVPVQEGKPTRVRDISSDPRSVGFPPHHPPMTSFLGVPIISKSQVVGNLYLTNKIGAAEFSAHDQTLVETLATQAAIAIENARLFAHADERLARITALHDIDIAIASELSLRETLNVLLDRVTERLNVDAAAVALIDPKTQDLIYAARRGLGEELFIDRLLKVKEGIVGQVAHSGELAAIPDVRAEPRFVRRPIAEKLGIVSYLAVPLRARGKIIGVLELATKAHRAFSPEEIDFFETLAGQAAIAIENVQLLEAERSAREQAETLRQVAQTMSSTLQLNQILRLILEQLKRVIVYDTGSVLLFGEKGELDLVAGMGYADEEMTNRAAKDLLKSSAILRRMARDHRPVIIADVREHPDWIWVPGAEHVRSFLAVPIVVRKKMIGALMLDHTRPGFYTETDAHTAQALARHLAIAIENARLFEGEQTRRAELGALYDLARALADALLDFDIILNLVTRHATQIVRVTFARVALLEGKECVIRSAHPIRVLDRDLGVGHREAFDALPTCYRAAQRDIPLVIHPDDPALTDAERDALFLGIAKTLCLVPLRVGGRALGLLMLGEARREEREPFTDEKIRLARSIGDQAASALHRAELFGELERAYLQTVLALANAVDAKDTYTADHAQRLAAMALAVGRELGLTPRELEDLRYGAILHDIGKIGIPDVVLKKPGRLDADEWAQMHQHPAIGERILAPVPRLVGAARIVRHHHERYDGKGYPDGLAGEAIPLGARILTVVDSYSAIVDARVYKAARSHDEAVAELQTHAGTQFDPRVVEMFLRLLERGLDITGGGLFLDKIGLLDLGDTGS